MKSPRPERATPRMRRIAQVKFVCLPMEDAPAPARPASLLETLRSFLFRVIGCPEAARP